MRIKTHNLRTRQVYWCNCRPVVQHPPTMARGLLEKTLSCLYKALMWALFAVYQLLSSRKPAVAGTQVAPVVNPLLLLPATELAKKIRRKEVRNQ